MILVEVVIAKLVTQGCARVKADSSPVLWFKDRNGREFPIPKPLENDCYNEEQLSEIEDILQAYGLDLLPLDLNQVA